MPELEVFNNRLLLPPNSIVGSCGTRWLCGAPCAEPEPEPARECHATFPLTEAIHEIVFACEDIPYSVAAYYFRRAANQFLIDSKVLKRDDEFDALAGDRAFCLEPCCHEEVAGIEAVCFGGCCLDEGTFMNCIPKGAYRKQGRAIVAALPMMSPGRVRVVWYAKISDEACDLDIQLKPYIPAISTLALSQLMIMPKKPWRDIAAATAHAAQYNYLLAQARFEAEFSGGNTQIEVINADPGNNCSTACGYSR